MSQRNCRIFISHSAHAVEEPKTLAFLKALVKRLAATPGLEALTDQKDLQAGDAWVQRLYAWMGLCDAAVILLSPRAVQRENSRWVPREANLLLWRKALDDRFVVIPVLLGDLKASDLATNPFIGDLRLSSLQMPAGISDKARIDAIVTALQNKLAAGIARLTFDPVRVHVEDCIQRYAPAGSVGAALVQHYAADAWQPYVQAHENLALKMVRQAADKAVDTVISDVALGSQGDVHLGARLFEALYPMRLPAESACCLLTLCQQHEGRGSLLMNANDSWALRMLLRAATGLPRDDLQRTWQIVELPDGWGDDDQAEVTRFLAAELAEAALGTGGWELLNEQPEPMLRLAEQLAEARRESGAPIVVCARYTPRWVELAVTLAARFRTAVFVFWTGDSLPPTLAAGTDCEPLSPAWPDGEDRRWLFNYRRKIQQLGGAKP